MSNIRSIYRSWGTRRRLGVFAVAMFAAAGAATGAGLAGGTASTPRIGPVGNQGTSVPAALASNTSAIGTLGLSGQTRVGLLGSRGDRAYYRIDDRFSGSTCYAVGPYSPGVYRFGQAKCVKNFPSDKAPVVDFTVFHGKMVNGKVLSSTVYRSEGIAADGVTSVAFTDSAGRIVARAPVKGNLYHFSGSPPGDVSSLMALSSSGKAIATQRLLRAGR